MILQERAIDRLEWDLAVTLDYYMGVYHNKEYWTNQEARDKRFRETIVDLRTQNFSYNNRLECYEWVREYLQEKEGWVTEKESVSKKE